MLPTSSYWVGISRDDNTVPFAFIDGTTIPQTASNSPWAHWSSQTSTLAYDANKPTWNCVQVGQIAGDAAASAGAAGAALSSSRLSSHPLTLALCPPRLSLRRCAGIWRTSSTLATRRPRSS
jgi:hypothetical protein